MINEKMLALGETRSSIRAVAEYGTARKAQIGADNVFDFSLGNPSVPSPKAVNDTIISLCNNMDSLSLHGYTPANGKPETRAAVAKIESRRAGYEIPPECVYMTCGAAASLTSTIKALANPGDKIAVFAPFFPEYKVFVENADAELVIIPPDGKMLPDLNKLAKAVKDGLKAVIMNSPNNPTGVIYGEDTISAVADILKAASKEKGEPIYLISDEPYRELVYGDGQVPFVPNFYDDTIICYSYSKSLSLPGERIGYVLVPPCVTDSEKVNSAVRGAGRSLGFVCAPSLFQSILPMCADERPDIDAYDRNRRLMYNALTEMGFECIYPDGAFYLFMKAPGGDAEQFCEAAKKYELLLVASDSFGVPGYVRISYCVSEKTILDSLPSFKKLAEECFGK